MVRQLLCLKTILDIAKDIIIFLFYNKAESYNSIDSLNLSQQFILK
jgi:hypothetical protein